MMLEGPTNPDGAKYDPPKTPEYIALLDQYPTCSFGPNYSCMFCHKCPYGDYFKWPKGAEGVLMEQAKVTERYMTEHGAKSMMDLYFNVV